MHTFRLSTFTSKNPSNWGVGESSIIIESAPARFSMLANSFPVMDIRQQSLESEFAQKYNGITAVIVSAEASLEIFETNHIYQELQLPMSMSVIYLICLYMFTCKHLPTTAAPEIFHRNKVFSCIK